MGHGEHGKHGWEERRKEGERGRPRERFGYSVLGTRYSVLGTQYSVLGTQYSVLSTQYRELQRQTFLRLISQPLADYCSFVYNANWPEFSLPSAGSAPTREDDFDTA